MSRIVGRVVVGVDGSPGSLEALRFACGQAALLEAVLVPVLAWRIPGGDTAGRRPGGPERRRTLQEAAEQDLREAFEQGLGGPPAHVAMEPWVIHGPAGAALVETANRPHDLLVIGAGRRGPVRHALHSGTARYCLTHALCPVIAVPPPRLSTRVPTQRRLRLDTDRLVEQLAQASVQPWGRDGSP